MPTTKDLFDDFVSSRAWSDPGPDDRDTGDNFRTSEHQLIEVIYGELHIVAGWQNPGGVDALLWIANEFHGWARRSLEERLREARLVVMTVMPSDDIEDGSDIIWWGYPVECMSCSADLEPEQRIDGLCADCIDLRGKIKYVGQSTTQLGIQQQQGMRGSTLPKSRPSGR